MKKFNIILLLTAFFLCCSYKENKLKVSSVNKEEIKEVLIKKVNFSIMTFGFVDCQNFESLFQKQFDSIRVKNQKVTKKFITKVLNLNPDTTKSVVDVRAKAIINYNNELSDTLCLGKFALLFNGKKLKYDAEFKTLLSNEFNVLIDE